MTPKLSEKKKYSNYALDVKNCLNCFLLNSSNRVKYLLVNFLQDYCKKNYHFTGASPLGLTKSVYNFKTSADTLFKPTSNFGRQDA